MESHHELISCLSMILSESRSSFFGESRLSSSTGIILQVAGRPRDWRQACPSVGSRRLLSVGGHRPRMALAICAGAPHPCDTSRTLAKWISANKPSDSGHFAWPLTSLGLLSKTGACRLALKAFVLRCIRVSSAVDRADRPEPSSVGRPNDGANADAIHRRNRRRCFR